MKLSEALFKAGDSMLEDRDLRDLLWEAAGLARRVEAAPVAMVVTNGCQAVPFTPYGRLDVPDGDGYPGTGETRLLGEFVGKRVAIVPIEEEG